MHPERQYQDGFEFRRVTSAEVIEAARKHERLIEGRIGGARFAFILHDLRGAVLSTLNLTDADLTGSRLDQAQLVGTRLRNASLFACDFRLACLRQADLSKSDLRGVSMRGADLTKARMREADVREAVLAVYRGGKPLPETFDGRIPDLTSAIAIGADMGESRMSGAWTLNADFTDANLAGVDFRGADLRGAVFKGANMQGANLSETRLHGTSFAGALLTDAIFNDAILEDANFRGAIMESSLIGRLRGKGAVLPGEGGESARPVMELVEDHAVWVAAAGRSGARADLSGRDLSGLTLSGRNLTAAKMAYAVARRLVLTGSSLVMADLECVDLQDAVLVGVDARGANFERTHLNGADLQNANLGLLESAEQPDRK
ncbi:pentapeptide repeat-containing protein, partial [Nitrospirillum viridazoti]|uniref:pentapeptide repeat-containing protein n=1 Tax=Nitrospirillum viridazoti TaxID=3144925 RepID=UPI0005938241